LREFLWDHLTGSAFLNRGMVSRDFLEFMLREHQSGRRNNSYWLGLLLMLELWFRNFESYGTGPPSPLAEMSPCPQ
jgi:hypothetical protein